MTHFSVRSFSLLVALKFLLVVFFTSGSVAYAEDFICDAGTATFTPASRDRVIATENCAAVTLNCSDRRQCQNVTVFAAAQTVDIQCTGRQSCRRATFNIGLGSNDLVYPDGYTRDDFDGAVNSFNLRCGDGPNDNSDRYACQDVNLNTFKDVLNQSINCGDATNACVGMNASLFNSNTDVNGVFELNCGATDLFQCDTSLFQIETAGIDFNCEGVTCIYTGCAEIGCDTPTPEPDIEDLDGDGQSGFFDEDDDGDGISDVVEEALGLDPGDNSDANNDIDGDGINNVEEVLNGTDPAAIELSVIDQALALSPKFHRFGVESLNDANCQQNSTPETYTVLNKAATPITVTGISIAALDSAFNNEYQVVAASDSCSGQVLAAGISCDFNVVYCPQGQAGETGSSSAAILLVNSDSTVTPVLEAALTSYEGAREEAQRRLPPIASTVIIMDDQGQSINGGELEESSTYTMSYSVSGYHSSYDVVGVLYDCSTVTLETCGLSFDQMIDNSGFIAPNGQSAGDWDYEGESITDFTYSFTFTTPAVNQDQQMVMRFFQKSAYDIIGGKFSLSLILPGNLPFQYIDSSGRRVAFILKNME